MKFKDIEGYFLGIFVFLLFSWVFLGGAYHFLFSARNLGFPDPNGRTRILFK